MSPTFDQATPFQRREGLQLLQRPRRAEGNPHHRPVQQLHHPEVPAHLGGAQPGAEREPPSRGREDLRVVRRGHPLLRDDDGRLAQRLPGHEGGQRHPAGIALPAARVSELRLLQGLDAGPAILLRVQPDLLAVHELGFLLEVLAARLEDGVGLGAQVHHRRIDRHDRLAGGAAGRPDGKDHECGMWNVECVM